MWFRCLGSCGAWLLFVVAVLHAESASAEDNRYAVSWAAVGAMELSGTPAVTTLRYDPSQRSDSQDRRRLSLEATRLHRAKLFNRVSVGKTFDGFGLRWEVGQWQLALTDDGVGARVETRHLEVHPHQSLPLFGAHGAWIPPQPFFRK